MDENETDQQVSRENVERAFERDIDHLFYTPYITRRTFQHRLNLYNIAHLQQSTLDAGRGAEEVTDPRPSSTSASTTPLRRILSSNKVHSELSNIKASDTRSTREARPRRPMFFLAKEKREADGDDDSKLVENIGTQVKLQLYYRKVVEYRLAHALEASATRRMRDAISAVTLLISTAVSVLMTIDGPPILTSIGAVLAALVTAITGYGSFMDFHGRHEQHSMSVASFAVLQRNLANLLQTGTRAEQRREFAEMANQFNRCRDEMPLLLPERLRRYKVSDLRDSSLQATVAAAVATTTTTTRGDDEYDDDGDSGGDVPLVPVASEQSLFQLIFDDDIARECRDNVTAMSRAFELFPKTLEKKGTKEAPEIYTHF